MNSREREYATLSFKKAVDRGAIEETFYPWTLTTDRWIREGLPESLANDLYGTERDDIGKEGNYLHTGMAEKVYKLEEYLGLDPVIRMAFILPFKNFDEKVIEETDVYIIRQDSDGYVRKHYRGKDMFEDLFPPVQHENDWIALKTGQSEK